MSKCQKGSRDTGPESLQMKCDELSGQHANLEVVFPVHHKPVAEHVPHDDQVGLLVVHGHAVHPQELGQQGAAVALDDVLEEQHHTTWISWHARASALGAAGQGGWLHAPNNSSPALVYMIGSNWNAYSWNYISRFFLRKKFFLFEHLVGAFPQSESTFETR